MPNHVTNELEFIGKPERVKELREKCKGKVDSPFSFQSFYPMPVDLEGTTSPANIVADEELKEWERKLANGELSEFEKDSRPITLSQHRELVKKYGTDNWYNWRINNWGTKWDCYSFRGDSENTIIFDTAWSTPIDALLELSRQFTDVAIHVRYADEDFGHNVGTYILEGGEIVDKNIPEYSKDSIKLAMEILGDTSYWLEDRLIEDVEDELDEFQEWLVELAHEEGNLLEEYPAIVLDKLLELAVRDEQYERATKIKTILAKKPVE
jgi:hypothetical protein